MNVFLDFSIVSLGFIWSYCTSLRAERLLLLRRALPLLLEKVNGERNLGVRASTSAKVFVAGLNQLARCIVVPRRILPKQHAERLQCGPQLLFGLRKGLFLGECGIIQIASVKMVQKEDIADMARAKRAESELFGAPDAAAYTAGAEHVVNSLVGLGLAGHKRTQNVALLSGRFERMEMFDELHGWSGLDELHGLLTFADFTFRRVQFQFFK